MDIGRDEEGKARGEGRGGQREIVSREWRAGGLGFLTNVMNGLHHE